MERKLKRQQRTVGAIVKIPLENGYHTYARILESKLAFYDSKTDKDLDVSEIIKKTVLFAVWVYDDIIIQGYWLKIGKKMPLEQHLIDLETQPVYTEDVFTGKYTIHCADKKRPATKVEIIGMESFTIWERKSIEERLNDYYAKRFNQNVYNVLNGRQMSGLFNNSETANISLEKQIV